MTERAYEPSDVGPIAEQRPHPINRGLRASDADREQVATVLSTAYAEGRLTRDEHDERMDELLRAKTFDDLVPITRDLVPMLTGPAQPAPASYAIDASTASESSESSDKVIAIFGGATRNGTWRVPRRSQSLALFGGIELDLSKAVFESPVVEISGFWCFGGLDITVPPGVEVRDQTAGVFGGTDVRNLGEPQPGALVLVIKGMSLFGGVSVHGPKPEKKRT